MIKRIYELFKTINFKDSTNNIKQCDVLLICHDVDRGISLNNQAYSPLIDSIKDEVELQGYTCTSIAHPWSKYTGKKAYGGPIAMNRSYFIARTINKVLRAFNLKSVLNLYERIITKANPKAIVSIGCNDELCEAARNLKVFHAELLHGIGYTPLPWNWDKKNKKHLPQGILSLDKVSTQTFSVLEKEGVLIKEIPHPFLRRFQYKNLNNLPNEWLPTKNKVIFEKEILVSLQWGYADGIDAKDVFKKILINGLFYDDLVDVIKKTNSTILWRFRFHPVQYRQPKKYKVLFDFITKFVKQHENCDWQESTYLPLPSILQSCSGHITMNSMVSYESAYLGITTLALCPSIKPNGPYHNLFEDLVEQGYLLKQPASANNILKWVSNVEKKEPLLNCTDSNDNADDVISWLFKQTN